MNPSEKPDSVDGSNTERSLLEAAIELYGQHGTQAVSLNQIRKHAQVANEAAIRYYFRNKNGLLEKSLAKVAEQLRPDLDTLAERLESLEATPDVRMILMHFGMPFASLYENDPNSVNFIGSLIHGEGAVGQKLLADNFGPVILRYERLLAQALPEKSPETIHIHFFLVINLLIHGLGDIGILGFMPSISDKTAEHFTRSEVLVEAFVEFVHAGMCVQIAEGSSGLAGMIGSFFPAPSS